MKKITTTVFSVCLSIGISAQTAITINSADMPVPNGTYNYENLQTASPSVPLAGSNQNWDYTSFITGSYSTALFFTETDSFFLANGIDMMADYFIKGLTPFLGYRVFGKFDFNSNGVDEKGLLVEKQGYSLSLLTGNANDSLKLDEQKIISPQSRRVFQFPMTANSAWKSNIRRAIDFKLSIADSNYVDTTVTQVFYTHREDTIIGWGKVRVNTPSGPSIPYDVLLQQEKQYYVDSFYMGGAPADSTLLARFGMRQGQITGISYRQHFLRKGSYIYLVRFNYVADSTYTTTASVFVNIDGLVAAPSSINEQSEKTFTTVLYPNPITENLLNLRIIGSTITKADYVITDLLGNTIQQEKDILINGDLLSINLNKHFAKGLYILNARDTNGNTIAKEQFSVMN